jgi:hypothetical protein
VTPAELRDLLADCLAVWGVKGRVEATMQDVVITTAAEQCTLSPAPGTMRPARWLLQTPERANSGRHPRIASSIAAAISGVRHAVG